MHLYYKHQFFQINQSNHILAFIIHINTHLKEPVDNTFWFLDKEIEQLLLNYEVLIFYVKVDYHLN